MSYPKVPDNEHWLNNEFAKRDKAIAEVQRRALRGFKLRFGTVTAYSSGTGTTVLFDGDTTASGPFPRLDTYRPVVGDYAAFGQLASGGWIAMSGSGSATATVNATFNGVGYTLFLSRVGKIGHIYGTVVNGTSAASLTPGQVLATLPNGWASARQEYQETPIAASVNITMSVNTNGTLQVNQTLSFPASTRLIVNVTYELAN